MIQVHPLNDPFRQRFISPARILETGTFRRNDAVPATEVHYVIVDGLDMLEIVETPAQVNMLLLAWEHRGHFAAGTLPTSVSYNKAEDSPEFAVVH